MRGSIHGLQVSANIGELRHQLGLWDVRNARFFSPSLVSLFFFFCDKKLFYLFNLVRFTHDGFICRDFPTYEN